LRFDRKHPAMLGSRNTTLDLMAMSASQWVEDEFGRPFVNHTGLAGRYDFTLTWALNPVGAPLPSDSTALQGPTLLEALRDQLGVRLAPAKLPMQTLIIDHLEKPPDN
jgi:uncharacterized protein (TIGR03435 family)